MHIKRDSTTIKKDSVSVDATKQDAQVHHQDSTVEEYEETTLDITSPSGKIRLPFFRLDSNKSTLNKLVFASNNNDSTLALEPDTAHPGVVNAKLQTPKGTQTFNNWSLHFNNKKYKRTTTGKSDSVGASLINKLIKNTFDSTKKTVAKKDTASVQVHKDIQTATKGFNLNFIIIGIAALLLAAVLIYFWKFRGK